MYLTPCQYTLASSGNFSCRKLIRKCCIKNFVCYISHLFRWHSYGSMHIVVSGYFLDWSINQEHSIRLPRSQTNYQPFSVYFVRFLSFMWSTDLKAKNAFPPHPVTISSKKSPRNRHTDWTLQLPTRMVQPQARQHHAPEAARRLSYPSAHTLQPVLSSFVFWLFLLY